MWALLSLSVLAATPADLVAVAPSQLAGLPPDAGDKAAAELSATIADQTGSEVRDLRAEREVLQRVRACGDQPACLARIGEELDARLLITFGVVRVGDATIVSLNWVDSRDEAHHGSGSDTVRGPVLSWRKVWDRVIRQSAPDGLPRRALEPQPMNPPLVDATPKEVKPPDPVVVKPADPPRSRTHVWITAGGAGVLLAGSAVTGLLAQNNYDALSKAAPGDRQSLATKQRTLNTAADGMLAAGVVTAIVATVLYVTSAPTDTVSVEPASNGAGASAVLRW